MKSIKDILINTAYNKLSYKTYVRLNYLLRIKYRNTLNTRNRRYENFISHCPKKRGDEKITVVFFCQFPSLWNGLDSIYRAALENKLVNAVLVAIPEKTIYEGYDVTKEAYGENVSYTFLRQKGYEVIDGFNDGAWFDLKTIHPDYVFLPRPYDIHMPEIYRSYTISPYAKVCYIPYGYDLNIWDPKMSYAADFLSSVHTIFAENTFYANMLNETFRMLKWNKKKIFDIGYPRFDLYSNYEKYTSDIKVFVWMPRWTVDSTVEASTFFQYKDSIINYFLKNKDLQLICRPHPLMLRNFESSGLMTHQEVLDFLKFFQENENFHYDEDGDYLKSFMQTDAFISDYSSLLIEEMALNKPVLYTGSIKNFDTYMKNKLDALYVIHDEENLLTMMNYLANGIDSKREVRTKIVSDIMNISDNSIGGKIIHSLICDSRE